MTTMKARVTNPTVSEWKEVVSYQPESAMIVVKDEDGLNRYINLLNTRVEISTQ